MQTDGPLQVLDLILLRKLFRLFADISTGIFIFETVVSSVATAEVLTKKACIKDLGSCPRMYATPFKS